MCRGHSGPVSVTTRVQGCLAHVKPPHFRTLPKDYAQGLMVVLDEGAVSYERGFPVAHYAWHVCGAGVIVQQ